MQGILVSVVMTEDFVSVESFLLTIKARIPALITLCDVIMHKVFCLNDF